jgi:hypothetical protein
MAVLEVEKNAHKETVFKVHQWPLRDRAYICSSACKAEQVSSDRWRGDGATAIAKRLTVRDKGRTSGGDKGRVLYYYDRAPFTGELRRAAAALLHVEDNRPYQLYDFCFCQGLHSADQANGVALLIRCAYRLAIKGNHKKGCLEMLVAPDQDPGQICQLHRFQESRRDRYGTWVKRCPVS